MPKFSNRPGGEGGGWIGNGFVCGMGKKEGALRDPSGAFAVTLPPESVRTPFLLLTVAVIYHN